jgi:hypothetical protein
MCVSIFTIIFKELITQLATSLDPSNIAKLDRSSGTRWPICKQVCPLDSMAIYPKHGHQLLYSPMIGEMKHPTNIPLPCAFHSISSDVDATHAPTNHQMIWSTSYHHMIILVHRSWPHSSPLRQSIGAKSCLSFTVKCGPSLQSHRLALHTCNWSVEPSHVLIFSTLIT